MTDVDETAVTAPPPPVQQYQAKSIVLFSDGTGNSSGKLFKTNVWRLYEAVDLGPSPDQRVQVAYYDNGVGTSSFRPLAVLGGIFGFGLKRNVLNIYRYVCRNYVPGPGQIPGPNETLGDRIFGFGFSRGAFTMRLVISMLEKEGIVTYRDERDLARKSADAYRAFCQQANPRFFPWLAILLRSIRNLLIGGWRRLWRQELYRRDNNYQPIIRFIGVWDTVAAYGGPFAELTRAIDNWVWPLSMPNYRLGPRIRRARHALAIDDEREAFHPLLWDEVHERSLIVSPENRSKPDSDPTKITKDRLLQVWFTGMHADVGGGYPDESLSYISLLWMIDEAKKSGLRVLDSIVDRYEDLSNSFGPVHDSRAGLAAYYRYQPRRIEAYLHPVRRSTLALRDPAIRDERGRAQGLLLRPVVHESVIGRISSGTDNYAPLNLPSRFRIVPLLRRRGNAPPLVPRQLRERIGVFEPGTRPSRPLLRRATRRHEHQQTIWSWVWARRIVYYITLFLSLGLILMPLWVGAAPRALFFTDGRAWIGSLINGAGAVLPGFARPLIDAYSRNPFYFLVFLVLIVLFLAVGRLIERILRDHIRRLWWSAMASDTAPLEGRPGSWLRRIRDSGPYQRSWQVFKWHLVPNLLGPLMLLFLVFGALSIYTQAELTSMERGTALCQPTPEERLRPLLKVRQDFLTRSLCHATGTTLEEGARYAVSFTVTSPWSDGRLAEGERPIDPQGMGVRGFGTLGGVPLRRVMLANYLQPLIEIRPPREAQGVFPNVFIFPLDLERQPGQPDVYRTEFVAQRSGELLMFANDSVLPFRIGQMGPDYFYAHSAGGGNFGSACVIVERLDLAEEDRVEAEKVPACPPPPPPPKRRAARPR